MALTDDRSLPELTVDLASQVGDLLRNEVRLARAEAFENIKTMTGGLARAALGLIAAGAAMTLALFALAYGLSLVMPMWAGALISAIVAAILAYVLVKSGLKAASVHNLAMTRTSDQVARDLRTLSRKADTP